MTFPKSLDNQPIVWYMELCSMLCTSVDGRRVLGRMNTCICMAESLCCSPTFQYKMIIVLKKEERKKEKRHFHFSIKNNPKKLKFVFLRR